MGKQKIVECVPNFSEGRKIEIVAKIAQCFQNIAGVKLIGFEADCDHNRSVITAAGEPNALAECVIKAVGQAVETIDLRGHSGEHPRIGAADVVPFVPVRNVEMSEVVELSKYVGSEIWRRWGVPVYLYENAASSVHRRNLASVRQGGFEGLGKKMLSPEWIPDYGHSPHISAGASVVGARQYLIAYNINLNTEDVAIAKHIASKIRFSSGGMKNCKALGLSLSSLRVAQVSMNLTDFDITGLYEVFVEVERLAAQLGVSVKNSELIGFVPYNAMTDAAAKFLKMDNYNRAKVLENNLD